MGWIERLEKRFGKYSVKNLMVYLIAINVIGFIILKVSPETFFYYLSMNPAAVMQGQIWRIVSFILFPSSTSLFGLIIYVYVYYMLGSTLERIWGSFTFGLYMLTGIVIHILGAMIIYWTTGFNVEWTYSLQFLYMSMFLTFALTFPEAQFLLFFFLPIKAKWFALIDAAYFVFLFVMGTKTSRIQIIMAMLNFLIFFLSMHGKDLKARARKNSWQNAAGGPRKTGPGPAGGPKSGGWQNATGKLAGGGKGYNSAGQTVYGGGQSRTMPGKKVGYGPGGAVMHRCSVCGITELDDPEMEFRYCSQCEGQYEYCADHLFTHKHVKS
ncbi:MAG: hypothetical protein IIZ51_11865 [Lachnospiraceae bacterium]|nr:hypothetical protein [Lachnospiraceae bacterium]MBQ1516536.1 hypothetical protein [Lachnospiraceae bacterium]